MTPFIEFRSIFKLTFICLVTFVCALSLPTYAKNYDLLNIDGQQIEVLIDPEHRLTVQNIIDDKSLNWVVNEQGIPSYGFSSHTYWFRFSIPVQDNESLLELNYALLDDISYYRLLDGKIIETIFTGDKRNFSDRPIEHRAFLFPIPESAQEQEIFSFTMLTVNADYHPVMREMHKPGEEKRMVVVLAPAHYADWLSLPARDSLAFLQAQREPDRLVLV